MNYHAIFGDPSLINGSVIPVLLYTHKILQIKILLLEYSFLFVQQQMLYQVGQMHQLKTALDLSLMTRLFELGFLIDWLLILVFDSSVLREGAKNTPRGGGAHKKGGV